LPNVAAGGAGLGNASNIGFSMPEINVFGVKSKGEKVFLALDSDAFIMRDDYHLMRTYFPLGYSSWRKPEPEWYRHPRERIMRKRFIFSAKKAHLSFL